MKPTKAFIFTAGMGTRLRPYTDHVPKPMVKLLGQPILAHIIDQLIKVGVTEITLNTHYKPEVIKQYVDTRKDVHINISDEADGILETGGGLKKALHFFNNEPFYAINGDAFWENTSTENTLEALADNWNTETSDLLLLLQPIETMALTSASGDYDYTNTENIARSKDKTGSHAFTGIRILHPRIFEGSNDGAFSFLEQMDAAETQKRLHGYTHKGQWHHISTPEDLENVNESIGGKHNG